MEIQETISFNSTWLYGTYDEWIWAWCKEEKVLLMDFRLKEGNIKDLLVEEETEESFKTKAAKVVTNIEFEDIFDAMYTLVLRDDVYDTVRMDWTNKEAIESFMCD